MKVTIEKVENGFLITEGERTFIAAQIKEDRYATYKQPSISEVLETIFAEPEQGEIK